MESKKVRDELCRLAKLSDGNYGCICAGRVSRMLSAKAEQLTLSKDQLSILREMIAEYGEYEFSNQQHFANAAIVATWLNSLA